MYPFPKTLPKRKCILGLHGARESIRFARELGWLRSYLRDTLAVLAAEQNSPCNATGVLSLQEKRLALALLEAEDFAVATDKDLTLL
jgi:hypothetical protein